MLNDGYIANGAEPWRLPDVNDIPAIDPAFRTDPENYFPYERNPETLARDWVRPGTAGLEHRVGGLEKDQLTGDVSYDPENHETMVRLREEKIQKIAEDVEPAMVEGAQEGDLLVVGWGGTYGAIKQGVAAHTANGQKVGHLHLRWLNPLPRGLEDIFKRYKKVLVCELNRGQFGGTCGQNAWFQQRNIPKSKGCHLRYPKSKQLLKNIWLNANFVARKK